MGQWRELAKGENFYGDLFYNIEFLLHKNKNTKIVGNLSQFIENL